MTGLVTPVALAGRAGDPGAPRVVAVLRAAGETDYAPVVAALLAGGVRSIELTLTTPGALDALPDLRRARPEAIVGVGTVTTRVEAEAAVASGAAYLVTPAVELDVIGVARDAGIPAYVGALTPSEVLAVWRAGASAVKIFPAETVGPRYGAHLRGPFPDLRFIPSGGVALDDIGAWMTAGASAVSLGGPLLGDALAGGSLTELEARAREATSRAGDVA